MEVLEYPILLHRSSLFNISIQLYIPYITHVYP